MDGEEYQPINTTRQDGSLPPNPYKSKTLKICGGILFCFNFLVLIGNGNACLAFGYSDPLYMNFLAFTLLQIINGVAAVIGGTDMVKRRFYVTASFALGIAGWIIFIIPISSSVIADLVGKCENICGNNTDQFINSTSTCEFCEHFNGQYPMMMFVLSTCGIMNIILCSVNCKWCSCCFNNSLYSESGFLRSQFTHLYGTQNLPSGATNQAFPQYFPSSPESPPPSYESLQHNLQQHHQWTDDHRVRDDDNQEPILPSNNSRV